MFREYQTFSFLLLSLSLPFFDLTRDNYPTYVIMVTLYVKHVLLIVIGFVFQDVYKRQKLGIDMIKTN